MEEIELEIGDIVYLKSGSPALTISSFQSGKAVVQWFLNGEIKLGHIPPDALTKESPQVGA